MVSSYITPETAVISAGADRYFAYVSHQTGPGATKKVFPNECRNPEFGIVQTPTRNSADRPKWVTSKRPCF
jgi:hypothetical protein